MMLRSCVVVAAVAVLATSCAFTTVETARPLDAGEQVVSGSLDWPGFSIVPRANANAMVGIADVADVSAHVGTTPWVTYNFGLGSRLYLGDDVMVGLQADAMHVFADFGGTPQQEGRRWWLTTTPRVMSTVEDDEMWYMGLQTPLFTGFDPGAEGSSFQFQSMALGPVVGIDHLFEDSNAGIQVELNVMPLGISSSGEVFAFTDGSGPVLFQFSIGGYRRN